MIPISILFLVSYIFDNDTSTLFCTKSVQFRDFFLVPVRHTLPLTPPQLSNEGRTLLDIGNCNIVNGCVLRPWDGSLLSAVSWLVIEGICTFSFYVASTLVKYNRLLGRLRLKFCIGFISLTRFSTSYWKVFVNIWPGFQRGDTTKCQGLWGRSRWQVAQNWTKTMQNKRNLNVKQ